MEKFRLLLVEDDINFGSILRSYLELYEFSVVLKTDGRQGFQAFRDGAFDLCVLDVMLPEMDGFSLAESIRDSSSRVPFIFLTARTLKEDQIRGFRLGADDYITKPFDTEVLLYKIRAILKRGPHEQEAMQNEIAIGKLSFNCLHRKLITPEREYNLTAKENELLRMLFFPRITSFTARMPY